MKTPFLDRIEAFYASIPYFKVVYTVELLDNDVNQRPHYRTSQSSQNIDYSSIQDMGQGVLDLVRSGVTRRLNGLIDVEESVRRCQNAIADEIFKKMHKANIRTSKANLYDNKSAGEDALAFLVYENTLTPEMKKYLLKSIAKKYGEKK